FLRIRSMLLVAIPSLLSIAATAQSPSSSTATAQGPSTSNEQVVLAPGDSVRLVVWRKPEMSGDFIVAPDGSITHPLYRAVRVGGVPFATAEANVRTFLARFEQ